MFWRWLKSVFTGKKSWSELSEEERSRITHASIEANKELRGTQISLDFEYSNAEAERLKNGEATGGGTGGGGGYTGGANTAAGAVGMAFGNIIRDAPRKSDNKD